MFARATRISSNRHAIGEPSIDVEGCAADSMLAAHIPPSSCSRRIPMICSSRFYAKFDTRAVRTRIGGLSTTTKSESGAGAVRPKKTSLDIGWSMASFRGRPDAARWPCCAFRPISRTGLVKPSVGRSIHSGTSHNWPSNSIVSTYLTPLSGAPMTTRCPEDLHGCLSPRELNGRRLKLRPALTRSRGWNRGRLP